jgi:hypothetical protein
MLDVFLAGAIDVAAAISLRIVSSAELQAPVDAIARDVRWAGPSDVYVGLGKKGVARTNVATGSELAFVMPPGDRVDLPLRSNRGRTKPSRRRLAVRGYGWIPLKSGAESKLAQQSLRTVLDIDARGDVVAVLGADGGDVQGLAADGVIAWTGSLSRTGRHASAHDRAFETGRKRRGTVRFHGERLHPIHAGRVAGRRARRRARRLSIRRERKTLAHMGHRPAWRRRQL